MFGVGFFIAYSLTGVNFSVQQGRGNQSVLLPSRVEKNLQEWSRRCALDCVNSHRLPDPRTGYHAAYSRTHHLFYHPCSCFILPWLPPAAGASSGNLGTTFLTIPIIYKYPQHRLTKVLIVMEKEVKQTASTRQILMALMFFSLVSYCLYAVLSHYLLLRRMKKHTTAIISSVMDSELLTESGS